MNKARNIFNRYSKDGPIDTTGANSVHFINKGNVTVTLNDVLELEAGESFGISQVDPETTDVTDYRIFFNPVLPGADIYSLVVIKTIIQKNTC